MQIGFETNVFKTQGKLSEKLKSGQVHLSLVKNDQSFQITTDTTKKGLTSLFEIGLCFSRATLNEFTLKSHTLRELVRGLVCFSYFHQKFEIYNKQKQAIRDFFVIKFLLRIPLINRFINWLFATIITPWALTQAIINEAFKKGMEKAKIPLSNSYKEKIKKIEKIEDLEKTIQDLIAIKLLKRLKADKDILIKKFFSSSDQDQLKTKKIELLTFIQNTSKKLQLQNGLTGEDYWKGIERGVEQAYLSRLEQLKPQPNITIIPQVIESPPPPIQPSTPKEKTPVKNPPKPLTPEQQKTKQNYPFMDLAEKIIQLENADAEVIYKTIIGLKDDETVENAMIACNNVLKNLKHPAEYPEPICQIFQAAYDLVKIAYGEWHTQRILGLCKNGATPSIEQLFGADEESFFKRYESLLKILCKGSQDAKNCLNILTEHYDNFFQKKIGFYLKHEISDSITYPETVFNQCKTIAELNEKRNHLRKIIDDWEKFCLLKLPNSNKAEINVTKQKVLTTLNGHYDCVLATKVPIYAKALEILKLLTPPKQDPLSRRKANIDALALRHDENWYNEQIKLLDGGYNVLQLLDKDTQNQISKKMEHIKDLLNEYKGRVVYLQLKGRKAQLSAKNITIYSTVKGLWKSHDHVKNYLSSCQADLTQLLDLPENATDDDITKKYRATAATLAAIPSSHHNNKLKKDLEILHARYQRSIVLQPLLNLAKNTRTTSTVTGNGLIEQVFSLKLGFVLMEEKNKLLTEAVKTEIEYQNTKPESNERKNILLSLTAAAELIPIIWEMYLKKKYSGYVFAKEIIEKAKGLKEELYKELLKVNLEKKFVDDPKYVLGELNKQLKKLKEIDDTEIPEVISREVAKGQEWLNTAYKEWEADRINTQTKKGFSIGKVLGLNDTSSKKDLRKKYHELQKLIHPDHNLNVGQLDPKIRTKFAEAARILNSYTLFI